MDKNVYETMRTPRASEIDKTSPWNVYPRPQMRRNSFFSLNGVWDFAITDSSDAPQEYTEKILVPFPPESLLSGIERNVGKRDRLHYRRSFTLPEGFIKESVILHLGAVDQVCDVYINGAHALHNEGGYIPFSVDITDLLREGENEIYLLVTDALSKIFPYGKQKKKRGGMWYTPVSGIWQTVWIESLPKNPITDIKITQTESNAKIKVNSKAEIKKIIIKNSGEIYEFTGDEVIIEPKEPKLWSPESPYLYEFTLETETDKIESYFALRSIGTGVFGDKARLTLNGKPYLFSGLLDQGYFPDGIFLPATPEGYEDDIRLAKSLGFNMLRKHIKIEPMYFYYLCDKLGMVVFQDMVNNSSYSFILDTAFPTIGINRTFPFRHKNARAREVFENTMLGTADLLHNCPSVLLYTIFNEGWGQFSADEMYKKLKAYDDTRIIDTASGWFKPRLSDVDSRHVYFRHPTIKNPDGKPLFLSEFGGYSLRIDNHLFGKKNYGYKLYESEENFAEAVKSLYLDGVLPLIRDGLSATVYTQLSDVEDETNGLITYDRRKVKISTSIMKQINDTLYNELNNL